MKRVAVAMLVPVGALILYAVGTANLWVAALAIFVLAVAVGMLQGA